MKDSEQNRDTEPPGSSGEFTLQDLFRSDLLPSLVRLMHALRVDRQPLAEVMSFSVVLDANKINSELRWRLGKRQKPTASTHLFEAIRAKVLVPYAPPHLEDEILEHAPEIAQDTKSSLEDVLREWELIRPLVNFYRPESQIVEVVELVDVEDLVYIATQRQLGLSAIYTDDPHLRRMGAPVIERRIDTDLSEYARMSSVSIGVQLGFGITVSISVKAAPVVFQSLNAAAAWLARQPFPVLFAMAIMIIVIARHPRVKGAVERFWSEHLTTLQPLFWRLLLEYGQSVLSLKAAQSRLTAAVPIQKKRTALMFVRAACFFSEEPASVTTIYRRMYAAGYRSRSANALPYIRQVLSRCEDFVEVEPGHWTRRLPAGPFDPTDSVSYRIRASKLR